MEQQEVILRKPFGPTLLQTRIPEKFVQQVDAKASQMLSDEQLAKKYDHSMNLAGNVQQEVRFSAGWLNGDGKEIRDWLISLGRYYLDQPPFGSDLRRSIYHFDYNVDVLDLTSMWTVSQWAGDFNPLHTHHGVLSGVFYTRMPKSLAAEKATEETHHRRGNGDIEFMCGGVSHPLNGNSALFTPAVGDLFLFPSWLTHTVYPFRTPQEERRSVSFNLNFARKG